MRKYEVALIVRPLEEEAVNTVVAKFENLVKNNGGEIEKIDRWGKRRLAYPIKDIGEGYYFFMYLNAEPKAVNELDRVAKITDEVLRHMVIRDDE